MLTVSPNRLATDYLILYTNQRAYLNPYGDTLTGKNSNPENVMRFTLYFRLLTQEPLTHLEPFEKPFPEALRYPRLDYVLIDLPSPFFDSVASHLKKWAQEVYRDQRCLLWKVRLSR